MKIEQPEPNSELEAPPLPPMEERMQRSQEFYGGLKIIDPLPREQVMASDPDPEDDDGGTDDEEAEPAAENELRPPEGA